MKIDLGWGTLSGGTPTNTYTGILITAEGACPELLNEPTEIQDGTTFQIETTTKWKWKITLWRGQYKDDSTYMTALFKVFKFLQGQNKYIRLDSVLFQTLHPSSVWVQVFMPAKMPNMKREGNLYAIEFPLEEGSPLDMSTF